MTVRTACKKDLHVILISNHGGRGGGIIFPTFPSLTISRNEGSGIMKLMDGIQLSKLVLKLMIKQ
jgi:hypothetical protein